MENQPEGLQNQSPPEKKKIGLAIAAVLMDFGSLYFWLLMTIHHSRIPTNLFMYLAIISAAAWVITAVFSLITDESRKTGKTKIGLKIILVTMPIVFFSSLICFFGLQLFSPLIAVFAPIIGIILGIASLSMGEKQIGKVGVILSVIAIAAPIVVVGTIILFAMNGVWLISFM